jgi:hypothetical protein
MVFAAHKQLTAASLALVFIAFLFAPLVTQNGLEVGIKIADGIEHSPDKRMTTILNLATAAACAEAAWINNANNSGTIYDPVVNEHLASQIVDLFSISFPQCQADATQETLSETFTTLATDDPVDAYLLNTHGLTKKCYVPLLSAKPESVAVNVIKYVYEKANATNTQHIPTEEDITKCIAIAGEPMAPLTAHNSIYNLVFWLEYQLAQLDLIGDNDDDTTIGDDDDTTFESLIVTFGLDRLAAETIRKRTSYLFLLGGDQATEIATMAANITTDLDLQDLVGDFQFGNINFADISNNTISTGIDKNRIANGGCMSCLMFPTFFTGENRRFIYRKTDVYSGPIYDNREGVLEFVPKFKSSAILMIVAATVCFITALLVITKLPQLARMAASLMNILSITALAVVTDTVIHFNTQNAAIETLGILDKMMSFFYELLSSDNHREELHSDLHSETVFTVSETPYLYLFLIIAYSLVAANVWLWSAPIDPEYHKLVTAFT